jgi:hypothetical protein
MTRNVLPQTLQTALSDMHRALSEGSFESQEGMNLTEAIGVVSISLGKTFRPVFSGDKLGLDLALLPFSKVRFWVMAHSMYAKDMVLHQVRTSEVMAVWDYEGKLESHGWSRNKELPS